MKMVDFFNKWIDKKLWLDNKEAVEFLMDLENAILTDLPLENNKKLSSIIDDALEDVEFYD